MVSRTTKRDTISFFEMSRPQQKKGKQKKPPLPSSSSSSSSSSLSFLFSRSSFWIVLAVGVGLFAFITVFFFRNEKASSTNIGEDLSSVPNSFFVDVCRFEKCQSFNISKSLKFDDILERARFCFCFNFFLIHLG